MQINNIIKKIQLEHQTQKNITTTNHTKEKKKKKLRGFDEFVESLAIVVGEARRVSGNVARREPAYL